MYNMTGKVYGKLTALFPTDRRSTAGNIIWTFRCTCGSIATFDAYYVRRGRCIDCTDCSSERVRLSTLKHGKSETAEFSVWTDIQTRCYNPNRDSYQHYGGRGIQVCERWKKSFDDFLTDMGIRPDGMSIERIDNDGDYTPLNCKWATPKEQANNKRNVVRLEILGVTKTISQWAYVSGLKIKTIWSRHKRGKRGVELIEPLEKAGRR